MTMSRAASCATLGTLTDVTSSNRNNRARCIASRASVLTRPPDGRCSFEGAATSHRIPCTAKARANPNPVGPASYATAAGHQQAGQALDPPHHLPVVRGQPGPEHLPGLSVDHRRDHRPGVHIQSHTRTLRTHPWMPGLPHMSDAEQDTPPR